MDFVIELVQITGESNSKQKIHYSRYFDIHFIEFAEAWNANYRNAVACLLPRSIFGRNKLPVNSDKFHNLACDIAIDKGQAKTKHSLYTNAPNKTNKTMSMKMDL